MTRILSDSWEAFATEAIKAGWDPEIINGELRNAFYSGCHFIMVKLATAPEELKGISDELAEFQKELEAAIARNVAAYINLKN